MSSFTTQLEIISSIQGVRKYLDTFFSECIDLETVGKGLLSSEPYRAIDNRIHNHSPVNVPRKTLTKYFCRALQELRVSEAPKLSVFPTQIPQINRLVHSGSSILEDV